MLRNKTTFSTTSPSLLQSPSPKLKPRKKKPILSLISNSSKCLDSLSSLRASSSQWTFSLQWTTKTCSSSKKKNPVALHPRTFSPKTILQMSYADSDNTSSSTVSVRENRICKNKTSSLAPLATFPIISVA